MKYRHINFSLLTLITSILILISLSKCNTKSDIKDNSWREHKWDTVINGEKTTLKLYHPDTWENKAESEINIVLFKPEENVTFSLNFIQIADSENPEEVEKLLIDKTFINNQSKEINESLGGKFEMKSFTKKQISGINGVQYSSVIFDGEIYCSQIDYRVIFGNYLITFYGSATSISKKISNKILSEYQEIFDAIVSSFSILPEKVDSSKSISGRLKFDEWFLIRDTLEDFSILFPAVTEYKTKIVNSEFGFIMGSGYFLYKPSNDKNLAYSALIVEYEGVDNYNESKIDEFFNYRKSGAIENLNGIVILEEKINQNQIKGRKYRILNEEKSIITTIWCYLSGEKLYTLSVTTPREYDNNQNLFKFLESFEIANSNTLTIPYVKRFGSNGCGQIIVPEGWKIHDEDWNEQLENYSGTSMSTIIRASDSMNSTFYLKLSVKKLDDSYTQEEIHLPENGFLGLFNEDLQITLKGIEKSGNEVVESNKARFISVGGASGCVYDYTYINQLNSSRKTLMHALIKGASLYYLTVSWDSEKVNNPMERINSIYNGIRLCDL